MLINLFPLKDFLDNENKTKNVILTKHLLFLNRPTWLITKLHIFFFADFFVLFTFFFRFSAVDAISSGTQRSNENAQTLTRKAEKPTE